MKIVLAVITAAALITFGVYQSHSASSPIKPSKDLHQFIENYGDAPGITSLTIPSDFVNAFVPKREKEAKAVLRSLDHFQILIYDKTEGDLDTLNNFKDELNKIIKQKKYEDLMVINDGGDKITIKILEENDKVKELVMLISREDAMILLFLKGDIDLDKIASLSKALDIDGVDKLELINGVEH